jgi:hypothetical protein
MRYAVDMPSGSTIYMPVFMSIDSSIEANIEVNSLRDCIVGITDGRNL